MKSTEAHESARGLYCDVAAQELEQQGWHIVPGLLSADECAALRKSYADDDLYRSTITMQRHGFGRGEYRYFGYPHPERIAALRADYYPLLADLANDWMLKFGKDTIFPRDHASFVELCHARGQRRPTPLVLRYRAGDYNCLHQDLYGDIYFPFQIAVLLSEPGLDFSGGEFIITEQRPRMQSRPHVVPLKAGDAILFAVNEAPRPGSRGYYRVKLRHGVSAIRAGERYALGIIFHDAA